MRSATKNKQQKVAGTGTTKTNAAKTGAAKTSARLTRKEEEKKKKKNSKKKKKKKKKKKNANKHKVRQVKNALFGLFSNSGRSDFCRSRP